MEESNNYKSSSCWNCDGDIETITKRLKEMFVEMGQKTRIERGQKPAERAVFRKQHGIAYGNFVINKDIEERFKLGLFAGDSYECAVRFSSDTTPTSPDLHSTLGVGLKLFGINGENILDGGTNADFIMQNIDRFFARDAQQMCSFTTAGVIDRDYDSYIDKHPELAAILQAMTKEEASVLSASYWAILPFKLGDNQIVKYRLVPENTYKGTPFNENDYLKIDLEKRLLQGDATFRFEIQLRTNPDTMPIDDAQVVWSTEESPYICIAKLHLPKQNVAGIGQAEFGSNLAFNIWRTLPQHEPLGSIAEVRKVVYAASAEARHQANGELLEEPKERNPKFQGNTDEDDDCIVTAGIYPPIGIMRVGNSQKEYFIGPLTDEPIAQEDPYAYRDEIGALKRQAAQFRVYGFNAAGKAVKELTAENAKITWHCHLANQKASWYQFQLALDIPEAADAPPSFLRNINVPNRESLLIDGGAKSISGTNIQDGPFFEGEFLSKKVYLGEMKTDEKGRLIMLGGHGKSENIDGDIAITFANNEGWYDDTSDGPVTAEVEYNGTKLKVDPAWVVCAPPDYAPMQKSVRTMWDLMRSVAVKSGMLTRPQRPSFTKDILPIFQRMTDLQWVNAGFAGAFGWGGQFNYTSKEWIKKLGNPSPAFLEMRRTISNNFRRIEVTGAEAPQLWPWLYGDAISIPSTGSVRQHATLSELQLEFLDQWVTGDFDADYMDTEGCPFHEKQKTIDDLPVHEQPDMLTKAAMDFCLADAFHPGCEMTWPMRSSGMYMAPFRVKHAKATPPVNNIYYGPTMSSDTLTLAKGPILGGQVAGGITRWMAIPWQTDTASCRDGYTTTYDPYLPTFWPARVPNNILNEKRYDQTLDTNLAEETRMEAFADRADWLNDLPLDGAAPNYTNQINSMIKYFDKLAVVQKRPGVQNDPNFPKEMQVGITPTPAQEEALLKATLKDLHTTLNTDSLNSATKDVLVDAVDKLSHDNLLNEEFLLEGAQNQLLTLVEDELMKDFVQTPNVIHTISLLASKLHNINRTKSHQEAPQKRTEVGIPEKMTRFSRYIPK
ncbi:catalase [Tenacibaculum skagerrakense]|uniref:Catalase n=1 Tax=Tenacibaculum skagerrakense TaxID=186571 RepID=A0A4R2NWB7_9FLAO|nr:LodA/GoxA family CTQ-dependent oxidase [Tenacibaculum skagerrakense]TCP25715.1 catalase [Tenacibaculum skagerrakense]